MKGNVSQFLQNPAKMLRLAVIFALCSFPSVFSLTEEMQELADTLHNTCVDETGVGEDVIENARKGSFADDDKLRCYMKCLMDQMACIDEDGIIDVDATIAVLPEEYQEKGENIIRKCGTKVGANPCDNAYLTNKCWYETDPDPSVISDVCDCASTDFFRSQLKT